MPFTGASVVISFLPPVSTRPATPDFSLSGELPILIRTREGGLLPLYADYKPARAITWHLLKCYDMLYYAAAIIPDSPCHDLCHSPHGNDRELRSPLKSRDPPSTRIGEDRRGSPATWKTHAPINTGMLALSRPMEKLTTGRRR